MVNTIYDVLLWTRTRYYDPMLVKQHMYLQKFHVRHNKDRNFPYRNSIQLRISLAVLVGSADFPMFFFGNGSANQRSIAGYLDRSQYPGLGGYRGRDPRSLEHPGPHGSHGLRQRWSCELFVSQNGTYPKIPKTIGRKGWFWQPHDK